MAKVDKAFAALDATSFATNNFRNEVHDYAVRCRGGVLPIAGADAAAELFTAYFDGKAPFAERRDKKSEFPDAMSLWLLEEFAKDNDTMGVIASKNAGWKQYAGTLARASAISAGTTGAGGVGRQVLDRA